MDSRTSATTGRARRARPTSAASDGRPCSSTRSTIPSCRARRCRIRPICRRRSGPSSPGAAGTPPSWRATGRGAWNRGPSAGRSSSLPRSSPAKARPPPARSASMRSMRHDAYGLPVSTEAAATVEAYDHAVEGLLSWDAQALERFRAATALDPGLALAHAGAAVCLFLEERFAEAVDAAKTARAAAVSQTDRERRHVEGLALLVEGKGHEAAGAMREHLADYPKDLLVFQRLYFVWFWQGKFPEMLALADALTHALYELAAFDIGIGRLPAAIEPCTHLGWFKNHLLWHLALMHMGRGEYDVASDLGRTVFEGAPSSIPGNLHDSNSLLWRLELLGRDVGERWKPFARIAGERLDRQALLFHAAHLAMALAASGDWTTAERQLGMLRERSARDRTGLVRDVLVPLV